MNANTMRPVAFLVLAFLVVQSRLLAWSGTSQVAWEKKPVRARDDWPAGVLALVNDPLRAKGWNPWFSEWPNDVNHYEIKVRTFDDVQHTIQKLAEIKADELVVRLDPAKEPRGLGFSTVIPKGSGIGAVFSIGSQKIVDQWFQRLPEVAPGVRKFGVRRFTEPPKARPPTLTLYVGNEVINLEKLDIPLNINVVAAFSDSYREKHKDDWMVKTIDQFVADRKAKQEGIQKRRAQ